MCISSNAPSPPPTQALHTPQPPPPNTAQDLFLSWGTPPVVGTLFPGIYYSQKCNYDTPL